MSVPFGGKHKFTSQTNQKVTSSKQVHQSQQASQGNSHPTGRLPASIETWFPMSYIYIGLCVSLSMPMLRKQRQQEPSNLSLMQFQLRRHCFYSQTIKLPLWVFNIISFIIPCVSPRWTSRQSTKPFLEKMHGCSPLDSEDLYSVRITSCECDMS